MESSEHGAVVEQGQDKPKQEAVTLPEGFKPHWHPVLVRGVKLHLPVRIPGTGYWLFKDDESTAWDAFPDEKWIVMGWRNYITGELLRSPYIKELPPGEAPDLGATVLTMDGVAKLLGLSSGRSARGFVKRHGIPHSRIGRQYLVRRAAVEAFIESQESAARSGGSAAVAAAGPSAERLGPVMRSVRRHGAESGHASL